MRSNNINIVTFIVVISLVVCGVYLYISGQFSKQQLLEGQNISASLEVILTEEDCTAQARSLAKLSSLSSGLKSDNLKSDAAKSAEFKQKLKKVRDSGEMVKVDIGSERKEGFICSQIPQLNMVN